MKTIRNGKNRVTNNRYGILSSTGFIKRSNVGSNRRTFKIQNGIRTKKQGQIAKERIWLANT